MRVVIFSGSSMAEHAAVNRRVERSSRSPRAKMSWRDAIGSVTDLYSVCWGFESSRQLHFKINRLQ